MGEVENRFSHCLCELSIHYGPVCFRLAYNLSVAERSKDLLASRFLFIVVQISEADYHRSENKQDV